MKKTVTPKSHLLGCLEYMLEQRLADRTISKSTCVTYRSDIRNIAQAMEALGYKPNLVSLQKVQVVDEVKLYLLQNTTLDGRSRNVSTVHRKLFCLKSLFNFWCERSPKNLLTGKPLLRNPVATLKLKKEAENPNPDYLSEKELAALLSPEANWGRHQLRNKALINFLFHTAVRREGAAKLNWADINFEEKLIQIKGKGGKYHLVPLNSTLYNIFKEYWIFRGQPTGKVPVFYSERGARITSNGITQLVKEHGKRNRVERLHPHLFRHTALSLAAHAVPQADLTRLAGHEDPATTNRYYIHTKVESLRQAVVGIEESMDKIMLQQETTKESENKSNDNLIIFSGCQ